MARHSPEHDIGSNSGFGTSKKVASGLLHSVSTLVASCSKQASRVSSKFRTKVSHSRIAPKSPLARPKQLLTSISNKAIPFLHKKKGGEQLDRKEVAEEGFGDGGVWQRAILMGDKCQPLDFSGVIYYDNKGEQLQELPLRSPRASPLPSYAFRK